jgi:hypothetical protein
MHGVEPRNQLASQEKCERKSSVRRVCIESKVLESTVSRLLDSSFTSCSAAWYRFERLFRISARLQGTDKRFAGQNPQRVFELTRRRAEPWQTPFLAGLQCPLPRLIETTFIDFPPSIAAAIVLPIVSTARRKGSASRWA